MSFSSEIDEDYEKTRQHIVEKYDRGYDENAEIDDWENADFFVYKVTDKYGFLHKNQLSEEQDDKIVILERERELKWAKMMKNWDKYSRGDKVLFDHEVVILSFLFLGPAILNVKISDFYHPFK